MRVDGYRFDPDPPQAKDPLLEKLLPDVVVFNVVGIYDGSKSGVPMTDRHILLYFKKTGDVEELTKLDRLTPLLPAGRFTEETGRLLANFLSLEGCSCERAWERGPSRS
jgi:hypothetical protein